MAGLTHTQHLFWELITAPEGVAHGLETLRGRESRLPDGLEGVMAGDRRMSAVERLDVYAIMYFYRLLDVVRDDYPAVVAVVGDDRFHNLVTDYLLAHPSSSPSVRDVGSKLPGYLGEHPLGQATPWLADLAAFEWTIRDAFDGPDAEPAMADTMQRLPPDAWAEVRFDLVPTVAILRLSAPVIDVWQAVRDERAVPAIEPGATTVLVWRQGFRVRHRCPGASEEAALAAIIAGGTFGEACEAVARFVPETEAPAMAARLLATWFADGLVATVRAPGTGAGSQKS